MQGDLFHIPVTSSVPNLGTSKHPSFLEQYRIVLRMDQLIMMLILMLIIFAVVFSMGVEKGKRAVSVSIQEQSIQITQPAIPAQVKEPVKLTAPKEIVPGVVTTSEAIQEPAAPVEKAEEPQIVITEAKAVETPAKQAALDGKYTIQVVTYVSEKQAERQIDHLKSKGYEAFVVPSGKYFQICVNAFSNKQSALSQLQALQVQKLAPHDAYVRSMPH